MPKTLPSQRRAASGVIQIMGNYAQLIYNKALFFIYLHYLLEIFE